MWSKDGLRPIISAQMDPKLPSWEDCWVRLHEVTGVSYFELKSRRNVTAAGDMVMSMPE
jgi:hypothetical protein